MPIVEEVLLEETPCDKLEAAACETALELLACMALDCELLLNAMPELLDMATPPLATDDFDEENEAELVFMAVDCDEMYGVLVDNMPAQPPTMAGRDDV